MLQCAVLINEDGYIVKNCQITPQDVLKRHASGVYTTALVTPGGFVVDWTLHRKRLIRGIEILESSAVWPSRPFRALLASLDAQGSSLEQFFDQHVVPSVQSTLEVFCAAPPTAGQQLHNGLQQQQQQQQQQHALLCVCVSPSSRGAAAVPTETTGADAAAGTVVSNAPVQTDPPLACAGAGTAGRSGCIGPRGHVCILVYCKAVQLMPYGPEHAVQAVVMGRPRSLPGAKACSWVQERRQYEEDKPAEAAEVLLSDARGRILEGLVTNFFVVMSTAGPQESTDPAAPAPVPKSTAGEATAAAATAATTAEATAAAATAHGRGCTAVLRVCGPQANAALPGVVQARVVQAAERIGLTVVQEPPLASERGSWSEAFITNCVRRIQPLSRVFCPPGNAWGTDPWDRPLPLPAGPYTTALLRELELLQERTHWREL